MSYPFLFIEMYPIYYCIISTTFLLNLLTYIVDPNTVLSELVLPFGLQSFIRNPRYHTVITEGIIVSGRQKRQ